MKLSLPRDRMCLPHCGLSAQDYGPQTIEPDKLGITGSALLLLYHAGDRAEPTFLAQALHQVPRCVSPCTALWLGLRLIFHSVWPCASASRCAHSPIAGFDTDVDRFALWQPLPRCVCGCREVVVLLMVV